MRYSLLNLFRFFAAITVVMFHFAYSIPPFDEGLLNRLIGNGHFAVTFFFVLSGFVMVLSNQKSNLKLYSEKIRFWKKRAIRLLPLYYLAIIMYVLFTLGVNKPIDWKEMLLNVIGVHAWDLNPHPEINPPSWSLSAEFFFYLLTPTLLLFSKSISIKKNIFIAVIVWLITVISFVFFMQYHQRDLPFNFFPLWHLSTFFIGITTAHIWIALKDKISYNKHYFLLFFIMCLTLFCTFNTGFFHKKHIALFAPIFAIIIFIAVLFEKDNKVKLPNQFFDFLGDLSYPIYILHWPFLIYFNYFFQDVNTMVWLVKYLCGLVAFSILLNFTIERFFKKLYKTI
jgi:peptidoglycan/LPS O-acetylase OafA/YrhL